MRIPRGVRRKPEENTRPREGHHGPSRAGHGRRGLLKPTVGDRQKARDVVIILDGLTKEKLGLS